MDNEKITFYESFSNFLTDCRENALDELKSDTRYIGFVKRREELQSKLMSIISTEARDVLEEYHEETPNILSMEYNAILLRGLTIGADVNKLFDASTPEYREFSSRY
jgi:hypothetical protein